MMREKHNQPSPNQPIRVRIPRNRKVISIVEQRVGANRMIVKCFDEKQRNCRIPGSLRRILWIRPGDTVIVEPWEFERDKRGNIVFKYTPVAIDWLKNRGYIKEVVNEF
ncbi:MAG: translation initiation factor eIF-1A [Nanoarchaeota archaeon]